MSQLSDNLKTIDGVDFQIYMLPPMESHRLLMELVKMLGPVIGPVIDKMYGGAQSKEILEQEVTGEFFSKAASALFSGLDVVITEKIIEAMKNKTHVQGEKGLVPLAPIFDIFFLGKIDLMYKWLLYAMQVQWGKCFTALGSMINLQSGVVKQ